MSTAIDAKADAGGRGLRFRPLRAVDLPQAWGLSQAVGWPHRLDDWRFAHALGQGQAVLDQGALVGVALRWEFGACATLGMIIVSASHRGRGIASRLVADALAGAAAPAALLHATPEGAGVYARQGFAAAGQVCQHQGTATARGGSPAGLPRGCALRAAVAGDLDALVALDVQASGLWRPGVLRALLEAGEAVVLTRDGAAAGFSMLRRFGRGDVVGPVVADDADAARALIGHWLAARAGGFVRVDVPAGTELGDWLADAGLPRVDTVTRMVRGSPAASDGPARTYALVSQALG